MTVYNPIPVDGYRPQSQENINLVNYFKDSEEYLLRALDELQADPLIDKRWLAIGRTDIERGFMAIVRSIFKPERASVAQDTETEE